MYARHPRGLVWLHWILSAALAGALGLISGVAIALAIFFIFLPLLYLFSWPITLAPLMGLLMFGVPALLGGLLGGSIGGAFQWLLRVRFHDSFMHAVRSYAMAGCIAALPMLPFLAPLLNNDAGILLGQLTIIGAVCGVGRAFTLRKTLRDAQKPGDYLTN
jgi:hypothetical protein